MTSYNILIALKTCSNVNLLNHISKLILTCDIHYPLLLWNVIKNSWFHGNYIKWLFCNVIITKLLTLSLHVTSFMDGLLCRIN